MPQIHRFFIFFFYLTLFSDFFYFLLSLIFKRQKSEKNLVVRVVKTKNRD